MSFAIKSTDSNLPPLIFGSFRGDIDSMFESENAYFIKPFPVDEISELGTDLVPIHNSLTTDLNYPSPDPNRYLYIANATASVGIYYHKVTPFVNGGVSAPIGNPSGVYLMLNTPSFNENSRVYLAVKLVGEKGVISWYVARSRGYTEIYWYEILKAYSEYTPYTPPEASGGFGLADKTSDPVDFPSLPLVSALGTGTVNMYRATQTSLREFSQYLWTGDFLDNIKKLFQDPMEALISVQIVPYTPSYSDTLTNVHLSWIDTGVQMYPLINQYVEVDCGSIAVSEYWGSALDYPPNTDISIFLPYIGMKSLSGQDVMGRTVHLKYHIDTLSGACVAMLKCSGRGLESVLYSWVGTCNTQIPVSARDFSNVYTSAAGVSASAGIAAAKGGAALAAGVVVASALNPASFDTQTRQSGSIGSTPSYLGMQTPFLCVTRPIDSTPDGFNSLLGRPSNLGGKIGDYSGYLEVTATHIEGFPATEKEKNMISSLLASGIII